MHPNRGLHLGRPLGSEFLIHLSWLPAGAFLSAHLALVAYGDRSVPVAILLGLITVGGYLVSVVLHALAHLVCARIAGMKLGESRVFPFGDVTDPGATTGRRRADAFVALSGPALSLVLGGALFLYSRSTADRTADILRTIALANVALAVVNLLPVLPLDGGRLVASAGRSRARLASFGGKLFGLLAVVGGGWLLFQGPDLVNETAAGLWLVLIGIFVFIGSNWQTRRAPVLPVLDGQTVGQWARPFAGRLDAASPAPAGGGPYAVAEAGRLAGVLTEARVREGIRVSDLMVPWTSDLGMPAETPLLTALKRLSDAHADVVVVVDAKGVVRGVLDEGAVRERLAQAPSQARAV